MTDKFKNKYRISSARLKTWDYRSNGFYFITICTKHRQHFFGEINDRKLFLNESGIIAYNCWIELPKHFHSVELGEFVVMPNHFHGIIIINNADIPFAEVETRHALSLPLPNALSLPLPNALSLPLPNALSLPLPNALSLPLPNALPLQNSLSLPLHHFRYQNPGKNSISTMIGSYKSAVTKLINRKNNAFRIDESFRKDKACPVSITRTTNSNQIYVSKFGWQPRFHDHIIRSYNEYIRISNYIKNNPANWKSDKFNK